ncbi:arginine repressor [Zhaonella formicivorans]|jgi:transcriptional regulator of arginine metabolism|uniref:arginine repressor n=1 Tax=Zhaonella formicivorans TaxID=2528593 RepID=UPI0010E9D67A|nr:arginine repressor [Zhaonella formicivorans]
MKAGRQRKILEIISQQAIETQEELANALRAKGYDVTQATVSRDIKEMGLVKIPTGENTYRYALPQENKLGNIYSRLERMFRDAVTSIDYSENLILIRTLPGTAHAVASCIDHIEWKEIIGTVAGDDTILVIVKPKKAVANVLQEFNKLLE